MAFSYGFFNAKNLDRVYTAEHFTSYLSSIICDGIQDTYGECFSITPAGGFQLRMRFCDKPKRVCCTVTQSPT